MAVNMRKVAIVGCGRSGSAVSFALMQSGLFSEMVLIDSLAGKAERVALDLAYGISFVKHFGVSEIIHTFAPANKTMLVP